MGGGGGDGRDINLVRDTAVSAVPESKLKSLSRNPAKSCPESPRTGETPAPRTRFEEGSGGSVRITEFPTIPVTSIHPVINPSIDNPAPTGRDLFELFIFSLLL